MEVNWEILLITLKTCKESSLVGQTQSACGDEISKLILLRIPTTKVAVFPVPDCDCAIKFFEL